MAVHCVYDTTGPEKLCSIFYMLGVTSRPAGSVPAPNQIARARAMDAAMDVTANCPARRRTFFACRDRVPFGNEQQHPRKSGYGASVHLNRKTSKKWEGMFQFVSKDGETVCVQLPHVQRILRSTVVEPAQTVGN